MAAYAAVVSLMHIMEQIQVYHSRHSIFDDQQQTQLSSLNTKVVFLQEFLERFSSAGSREVEDLESQITEAIYDAEDLIESQIVDHIHALRCNGTLEMDFNYKFSHGLEKLIKEIDFIQREAVKIEAKTKFGDKQPMNLESVVTSYGLPPTEKVAFGETFQVIMNKLTRQKSGFQTIPITGMGGIGKTTLAKTIFDSPLTKEHFDMCGWITVSQEFDQKNLLFHLLHDMKLPQIDENMEYHELGHILHKHLSGRRYLIIMDDIWSHEAWDKVIIFLPDNNKGSRVIITTRELSVANTICSSNTYKMKLLDEDESWGLLHRKVFDQGSCPSDLEEVGKRIAKNCRGLPLSIVVIAGVLAKSKQREYWENIAKDISACVNSEDDERYFQILHISYRHLPVHLKPCFLYFGVFPEDDEIKVSELVKLWVAEGFIKPKEGKSLEEVARDYLNDLIDRNLIFVSEFGSIGSVKYCKIHDLLRDLSLREGRKHRFLFATKEYDMSRGFNAHRRIAFDSRMMHGTIPLELDDTFLQSSPFIRSVIFKFEFESLPSFKLLRVLNQQGSFPADLPVKLVNLRYIKMPLYTTTSQLPISVCLLWNLQIVRFKDANSLILPSEILEMPQLRHVKISYFCKLDGSRDGKRHEKDNIVLENLQTLYFIRSFRLSEEVIRKIPNLKKLGLSYGLEEEDPISLEYLKNLGRLTKLESLSLSLDIPMPKLEHFPLSLKKLTLSVCNFNWEDMGENIGSLPHLEKLILHYYSGGEEWNSYEGQFCCLKYLHISCSNLQRWTAESSHFPCLEHLSLYMMRKLEEIPPEIGDIPTLKLIELENCSESVITLANRMLEEQRHLGNDDLRVYISDYVKI